MANISSRMGCLFAAWFVFCALLGLAMLGVLIWALVEFVQWVTTK